MPKQYSGLGLTLLYPDTWAISEEAAEGRPAVSLESPGGSFLSICSMPLDADPVAMLEEAAEAMNAEYEDVETEPYTTEIGGHPTTGIIQRFYYLDLLVASKLLAIQTDEHLYLVQIQGEDRDMDQQSLVFEAILTSAIRSLHGAIGN